VGLEGRNIHRAGDLKEEAFRAGLEGRIIQSGA